MRVEDYIARGFRKVAIISKLRPIGEREAKHGTYLTVAEDLHRRSGVYLLVLDNEVRKIGESVNMANRLMHYKAGTQPGNIYVRERIPEGATVEVYFIDCVQESVEFAGVSTVKGVSYRDLEKVLIKEFIDINEKLPDWNKGIQ